MSNEKQELGANVALDKTNCYRFAFFLARFIHLSSPTLCLGVTAANN